MKKLLLILVASATLGLSALPTKHKINIYGTYTYNQIIPTYDLFMNALAKTIVTKTVHLLNIKLPILTKIAHKKDTSFATLLHAYYKEDRNKLLNVRKIQHTRFAKL
jgi:hypothetical protein